jgi:putative Ca2+/H+ antiporter (TMEM165/GDT1 family)
MESVMDLITPFFETFFLVFLAEFGDKSQLVAMTLAARYRPAPVIVGAVVAFSVLNLLAVVFGAAVAQWVPGWIVAVVVAVLFFVFGFQSLRFDEEADDGGDVKVGKQLLLSVFLLIFMAEFGDKTQLAVAALGSINNLWIVWGAATLALLFTTLLGVLVGRKLLYKLPLCWIHRGSGILFVVFGCVALYESVNQFTKI